MSQKNTDEAAKVVTDTNQDGMPLPPPPSYANSAGETKYSPPAGGYPPPSQPYYQAQPVGGASGSSQQYAPPAGAPPNTGYAPPAGAPPNTGYAPSPHPSAHHVPPPAGGGYAPPPGHAVVYVVDNDRNNNIDGMAPGPGMPVAMICFIFGLCTYLGYLFGMCFMNSPDPRERWWARMCAIMCIIWSLIIIFAAIFGR